MKGGKGGSPSEYPEETAYTISKTKITLGVYFKVGVTDRYKMHTI